MIISMTPTILGQEIKESVGLAPGNVTRARFVGGDVHEYIDLMPETRNEAYDRMQQNAATMQANAVVNVRFATSMIMEGTAEILAYGTAVKLI